jgi:hypothetical protein
VSELEQQRGPGGGPWMEEVAAEPTETLQENRIQVSNTKKPLFFYVNLAKVRLAKKTAMSVRGAAC